MYLLVCLAVLGAVVAVPLEPTSIVERNDALYVLPTETFPTFYDISLFLNPDNEESFSGDVSIRIASYVETNKIVLHAMEIDLDKIELYREFEFDMEATNLYKEHDLATDDTHLLTITTTEALQPFQPYTLKISNFTGHYAENMFGIYLSKYEDSNATQSLITSQLQPTFARRAFPCYDEPALKAIFRTTIYAPEAYPVVRSNTVIRANSLKENVEGWLKYEFEDTLVMSTYLLAYLVSNFQSIDNSENPIYHIPFSVYSRPGTQEYAEFALTFGQDNMVALENYTEFAYEFPKMDKVAVPDFAAGAMENWGLVIYREVALLVQKGVTTTSVKQNIGRIICHENVHQWFGNEVSPRSWTYTWLNEGFANFFENFATDLVLKGWRMMDQFVIALQNVFQSDAVLSVNPMTHTVRTPSEILGTFNAVAYQKSGSVIRMMQHFLTPEVFRKGLAIYIKKNTRKSAVPADLYAALQEALDESSHEIPFAVSTVMNRWANQGGFPVIKVRKTAPSSNSVSVIQQRYLTDSSLSSNDRWHIPVNWVLSTDVDFEDTKPQAWVGSVTNAVSIDIPGLNSSSWFIFNKQQTGYYRVDYEPSNWEALAGVLRTDHLSIHVLNRAQLLDDSFNLARNGRLSYVYAFDLSLYLEKEDDYIPWAAVNPAFSYLDLALNGSPAHALFKSYLLSLTAPLFAKLGFDAEDEGEEHVTPYHRNIILNINCQHGNEECISAAQDKLQNFRNNPDEPLNPDIQTTVFCSGLRGGDEENFNFLWAQYLRSDEASQQSTLLSALGCTSNPTLLAFYMDQVINDDSPVREQDRHSILVSVINSSPENADAALDFVTEHWPDIQPRVQGLTGTTNILNAFARRLTTEEHATKIEAFSTKHQSIFTAGELASIAGIKENIDASIAWSKSNAAVVEEWLENKFSVGGASGLTAGFVVILSFAVALFNH